MHQEVTFLIQLTGAKTNASLPLISYPYLLGYDSTQLTQSLVEGFLGHTSAAPCASIFDATSMGTDAIGGVIDMQGQVQTLLGYRASVTQSAGGTPANGSYLVAATQGGMAGTSLTLACATYNGDIYFRLISGNLDSTTAGFISITFYFKSI